jgi:hypothetical protein
MKQSGIFNIRVASWPECPTAPPPKYINTFIKMSNSTQSKGFFGQSVTHWQHKPTGSPTKFFMINALAPPSRIKADLQLVWQNIKVGNSQHPLNFGANHICEAPPLIYENGIKNETVIKSYRSFGIANGNTL